MLYPAQILRRLLDIKRADALVAPLPSGATRAQIAQAEEDLGLPLPAAVRVFYSWHDGGGRRLLLDGHHLLSLPAMVATWRMWQGMAERGELDDLTGESEPQVQPVFWCSEWIPLTTNDGGGFHVIDLQPTRRGVPGQIVKMWAGDALRLCRAPSFVDFLLSATWERARCPRWSQWPTRHLFRAGRAPSLIWRRDCVSQWWSRPSMNEAEPPAAADPQTPASPDPAPIG